MQDAGVLLLLLVVVADDDCQCIIDRNSIVVVVVVVVTLDNIMVASFVSITTLGRTIPGTVQSYHIEKKKVKSALRNDAAQARTLC